VSAGEEAGPLAVRQLWRERRTGRLVVIARLHEGLVAAFDPGRDEELVAPEPEFRRRFDSTGLDTRPQDRDAPPSQIETRMLVCLQDRPSVWLHTLVAEAEQQRQHGLAQLGRQVLALRGEDPVPRPRFTGHSGEQSDHATVACASVSRCSRASAGVR